MKKLKQSAAKAVRRCVHGLVRVFIAHVRANVWCLFHFGHCILTHRTKAPGCLPQTYRIEAGTGSILNGTWKTVRVFYANTKGEARGTRKE